MKWDIDKAMAPYEPNTIPGTIWQRVLMQVTLARKNGLKIPEGKRDNDSVNVWSCGVGMAGYPKHFVYGWTMRECFLRLRRQARSKEVQFNPQLFPKLGRKKTKPKERKHRPRKERTS